MRQKQILITLLLLMIALSFGQFAFPAQAASLDSGLYSGGIDMFAAGDNLTPFQASSGALSLSPARLIYSRIQNTGNSPAQVVTITNTSATDAMTINSITITGTNANQYAISGTPPATPLTLNPGQSVNVNVVFNPTSPGVKVAALQVTSNAPTSLSASVELRGLGAAGSGGMNEPSLQWILDTFNIPVNVGDDNPATTPIHSTQGSTAAMLGEEVYGQRFTRANTGQPVTIQVLGGYAVNTNPVNRIGWYTIDNPFNRGEVFTVNFNNAQMLNPAFTVSAGATVSNGIISFTPGTTNFGLYSIWPSFSNREVFSEDFLNTWEGNAARRHKMRFYPMKNQNGTIIPNTYIVSTEEYTSGFDYNDIVYIISNVTPIPAPTRPTPSPTLGGPIRTTNLDWTTLNSLAVPIPQLNYLNTWLTFSRHRSFTVHRSHDEVRLRIHNDGASTLPITGLTISNTTKFSLPGGENPTPGNPLNIPAGGFYDLRVRFIDNSLSYPLPGMRYETLTITSSAHATPTIIQLAGGYMRMPQGSNELTGEHIVEAFGFTTNLGFPVTSGTLVAHGDEVLSGTWRRAVSTQPVYVRKLAALHGCCSSTASFNISGAGGGSFSHQPAFSQSLLPPIQGSDVNPAERIYNPTSTAFTITIAGYTSTATTNLGVRFWPVRDRNGAIVPNAYIVIQDYVGSSATNYDFNDNAYLVTNIEPATIQTDVTVAIDQTPQPVLLGNVLTYTVRARNLSVFTTQGVNLTFNVPAGFAIGTVSTPAGTCSTSGQTVSCALGAITGESQVPVTVQVTPSAGGFFQASASVTTTTPESSTANNSAQVTTQVNDPVNLPGSITIVKSATPQSSQVFTFNATGGLGTFNLVDSGVVGNPVFEAHVNFQSTGAPVPSIATGAPFNYVDDSGAAYGLRLSGLTYGWVSQDSVNNPGGAIPQNMNGEGRDRNRAGIEQRLDTIMHMQRTTPVPGYGAWEIAVPNGEYTVTVSVGDQPAYNSQHYITVEGVPAIVNFVPSAAQEYRQATVTVNVTDGKLTVHAIGGVNTKINYIDIVSTALITNTRTFSNILPGTYNITEVVPSGWSLSSATCTGAASTSPLSNGVSVQLGSGGNVVCTFVNGPISGPAINIDATPDTQTVVSGGTANFSVTVRNIGTVTLTNVNVNVPEAPGCNRVFASMPVNGIQTYTCSQINVTAPFTANFAASGTNSGNTVNHADSAQVTLGAPAITISKTPDTQLLNSGQTANFSITVTNTGNVPLTGVVVSDPLAPDCNRTFANLAPAQVQTYACSLANVTAGFINTANVTANGAGTTVTASDTAQVTVQTVTYGTPLFRVNAGGPVITDPVLNWSADQTGNISPYYTGSQNSFATGTSSGTNTTAAPNVLFNTERWDPSGGTNMTYAFPVPAGQIVEVRLYFAETYTGITAAGQRVFGVNIDGTPVLTNFDQFAEAGFGIRIQKNFVITSDGTVNIELTRGVENPALKGIEIVPLSITGSASLFGLPNPVNYGSTLLAGAPIVQTVTLTNVGTTAIDISAMTISGADASLFSIPAFTPFSIPANGNATVDVTFNPQTLGVKAAALDVTHNGANGPTLSIPLNATVATAAPAITIVKGPDQTVGNGGTANFTITVTNTGNVPLTNVTVVDPLAPACANSFATLAAGASQTYTCAHPNVTSTYTNTATVTGTAPDSTTVTASDTALVTVALMPTGTITIIKDANVNSAQVFSFNGTNGIGAFTLVDDGSPAPAGFEARVNFQPFTDSGGNQLPVPAGYLRDSGQAYGPRTGANQGTGLSFGWITEASVGNPGGGTPFDRSGEARIRNRAGIDPRQDTIMHMERAGQTASAWEFAVPNGLYRVTVSVGDQPNYDSTHVINVENVEIINFQASAAEEYRVATVIVNVTDGRITIDSRGGTNTKLNYVDIAAVTTASNTRGFYNLASGTYEITETVPGGWGLMNVVCSGGATTNIANGVSIVLNAGDDVICTFNNLQGGVTPAITIVKDADQTIISGGNADFTITVTNTGNVPLTNVAIDDPLTPSCANTFATLAAGASQTYTCQATNVTASFTNTATVTATHNATPVTASDSAIVTVTPAPAPAITIVKDADQTIISGGNADFTIVVTNTGNVDLTNVAIADPLTPSCANTFATLAAGASQTYTCQATNVTASFTNTATVTATYNATPVTASDSAIVTVTAAPAPAITIVKDADQTITSGSNANFTIVVTNTGNVDLTNVAIADPLTPSCANTFATLAAGASQTYTCQATNVTASFTNTATVTATYNATPVTASDSAIVTVTAAPAPAITIVKDADQTINSGANADFTITVTNTGNVDLTNVAIADPLTPSCANTFATLAAGASQTYTCQATNVTASFTNTATVTATPVSGGSVTASDSAIVTVFVASPSIDIQKNPATQTIVSGGNADFTIVVTNNGNVDLTNVGVIDPLTPSCGSTIGNLAVGASQTYTCQATNVIASFTNSAIVTGDSASGSVSDTATADVVVTSNVLPAISVSKGPDNQTVNSGDTVFFDIVVTNTGNVELTNITVTNNAQCSAGATLVSGDTNANNILDVGEIWNYTCWVDNVIAPFITTATVTGTAPNGTVVTASDSSNVNVNGLGAAPSIDITASPGTQTIGSGSAATYTVSVHNNGASDLINVLVSTSVASDCTRTFATLIVNEVQTFTCITANVTSSFDNIFTASGTAVSTGGAVSDSITLQVLVSGAAPSSQMFSAFDPFITKNANPPFAIPGEAVTFTFVISNPGSNPATNVVAVDPMPAEIEILSATAPVGTVTVSGQNVTFSHAVLQPGEVVTVTIQTRVRNNVAVPFIVVNEVCMTGDGLASTCATASVISISTLPATGETPLWSILLRGFLAAAAMLTLAAGSVWSGRKLYSAR